MLCEHRRALKKVKEEDEKDKREEFNSLAEETMNYRLQEAWHQNKKVAVRFFQQGESREIVGYITKYQPENKKLFLKTETGEYLHLQAEDILGIWLKKGPR